MKNSCCCKNKCKDEISTTSDNNKILKKKTKIVATIGMNSATEDMLQAMSKKGVNIFRLNFSHGDHAEHKAKIDIIKKFNLPGAILLDTKGPEIRTAGMEGKTELKEGDKFIITVADGNSYEKTGKIGVSYKEFLNDIEVGNNITIDGNLIAEAISKNGEDIEFLVKTGSTVVSSKRHINVQGRHVSLPTLTENDWKDIDFGIEQKVDYIAMSFVRTAKDVQEVREYCAKGGLKDVKIISKIENCEAVENLEELVLESDGIMIARGDLALEAGYAKVPTIHKRIMELCSFYKKPVIVATQMMASMVTEINPTRAEVSDVAHAVYEGADAIMLSEEATKSKDPSHVVNMMADIALEAEKETYGDSDCEDECDCNDNCCCDCHLLADDMLPICPEMLEDVDGIVIISKNYDLTRIISNARIPLPTFSFTDKETYRNQMNLLWNVKPFMMNITDDFEANVTEAEKSVCRKCIKTYLLISEMNVKGKMIPTIQVRELE